nr:MAG TPA: hypothetical protein [Caudoviricetes sp.]
MKLGPIEPRIVIYLATSRPVEQKHAKLTVLMTGD